MNKYTGIADYYDLLMAQGYYDYEAQSDCLAELLKHRKSVLELGVGTGLLAEKLIQKLPDLEFVGMDFTPSMLKQARERLGESVNLMEQNVISMELEKTFDTIFSNGGVWYFIENSEDEYIFCSHLPNIGDNLNGLRRVASHLKKFGELIFSVQGVHRDYEETLPQGVTYAQKITQLPDNCFDKCYIFSQEGEVMAEQICKYRLCDEEESRSILRDIGLEFKEITSCRQYHVYHKVCELS